jgi:hypothetical protein
MIIVAAIFVPLVLAYQGWSYWVFRQRLTRPTGSPAAAHGKPLVSREGHRAPEQDRSVLPAGQEPVGVAGVNVAAHQPAGSLTPW